MWLSLSGVIGLALGDAFLFQSYILVGARIGTLLLSLSTVFGVLEAWLIFGETLRIGTNTWDHTCISRHYLGGG